MASNTNRVKKGEIAKAIILGIGLAGFVAAAFVAPGLLYLVPRESRRRYSSKSIKQSAEILIKNGAIICQKTKNGIKMRLSDKGERLFLEYQIGEKMSQKHEKWDGRWRLLIFDIPVKRDYVRNQVRKTLISLGFVRLQDSVWVFPYECENVIDLLRVKYGCLYEALYVEVSFLTNDRWLRKEFRLA